MDAFELFTAITDVIHEDTDPSVVDGVMLKILIMHFRHFKNDRAEFLDFAGKVWDLEAMIAPQPIEVH